MTVLTLPCAADQGSSAVFIEVNKELLSARLEKATLSDVLRAVGEQAGARVFIQGTLGNVQPQVFWIVPLPEGLKLLVQNSNADLVLIYNRDKAGHRCLQEIRAYEGNRNTFLRARPRIHTLVPPPLPAPPGGS